MELPEDVVLEILVRVGDAAALCTACQRWRDLIADPTFVRRRQRDRMTALGVHDAEWALSKVVHLADVSQCQNRLLPTKSTVQHGPIPRLFPELEQLRYGVPAVTILDAEASVENVAALRYLDSIGSYRICGTRWQDFVTDSRISEGDRLDLYAGRRGAGERCLLFFNRKRAQV